jgi:vancomycin permeability regulator SanA
MKQKKIKKMKFIPVGGIGLAVLFFVISNLLMMAVEKKKIVSDEKLSELNADCILILGAAVWANGQPSHMLADRLDEAIRLYQKGICKTVLVSGDHGRDEYDEVNTMKNYLINAGLPGEDIFMDHAGFSTYESVWRAKEIFGVEKMIVVTQEYHMYRALYISRKLGVEALGAPADPRTYVGTFKRNLREWLARDKDILYCLFRVKPTYEGEAIDIKGSGDITND